MYLREREESGDGVDGDAEDGGDIGRGHHHPQGEHDGQKSVDGDAHQHVGPTQEQKESEKHQHLATQGARKPLH